MPLLNHFLCFCTRLCVYHQLWNKRYTAHFLSPKNRKSTRLTNRCMNSVWVCWMPTSALYRPYLKTILKKYTSHKEFYVSLKYQCRVPYIYTSFWLFQAPKINSVVGILGHLAGSHLADIRTALLELFQVCSGFTFVLHEWLYIKSNI